MTVSRSKSSTSRATAGRSRLPWACGRCPSSSEEGSRDAVSGPFEAGERALLVDDHGRRFLVRLQAGTTFHFHGGAVPHDLIVGSTEGTVVHSTTGAGLICL